jgi:hypothetical protein
MQDALPWCQPIHIGLRRPGAISWLHHWQWRDYWILPEWPHTKHPRWGHKGTVPHDLWQIPSQSSGNHQGETNDWTHPSQMRTPKP